MSWGGARTAVLAGVVGIALSGVAQTGAPSALSAADAGTMTSAPAIKFDVVSFKACKQKVGSNSAMLPPDGDFIAYKCQPVGRVIYFAYAGPHPFLMSGEPDWVDKEWYDFQAKVAPEDVAVWQKMDLSLKRVMVQGLLAEALNLKQHTDTTPRAGFILVVAKGGAKLTEYKDGETKRLPDGRVMSGRGTSWLADGTAVYQGTTMGGFVESIAVRIGRQVIDKTELPGLYDLSIQLPFQHYDASGPEGDAAIPAVFGGLKELGLRLEPAKVETGGIVIDHIERPGVE